MYVKICSRLNLHVEIHVLLIIIDLDHTNKTLAVHDIAILLKKLEIKFHSKQNISDAATVKELCNKRDNAEFNLLSFSEITKLIDDICIKLISFVKNN